MRQILLLLGVPLFSWFGSQAGSQPKPVPRMQAVPLPGQQISLQREGSELARYHFGPELRRPFVFPIIGPAGRSLTRMGHPHDPVGHSHHNSVWIAHKDVNGVNFWEDSDKAKIVHLAVERFEDDDGQCSVTVLNAWVEVGTKKTLLHERRRMQVKPAGKGEFLLRIDLELEAKEPVTFGKTPFGLLAVRMAKTIGVNDGGGTIRNSAGQVNEKEVFWKPARWVDYSGPIIDLEIEGITLFDHPANPSHPSVFHVRNDGWMGASFTQAAPRTLAMGDKLRLRYELYIHAGMPTVEQLQRRWETFAKSELDELKPKKK